MEDSCCKRFKSARFLVKKSLLMPELFGLDIENYSGDWTMIKDLDCFALDCRIRSAGWNFFFMAAEVEAMFFGAVREKKIQNALHRVFGKVRQQPYNALQVTGIVRKRFLGVPYTIVSAHSRHIQQSCYLNAQNGRWTSQIATTKRAQVEGELRLQSALS
jgi:hypothetical protein